MSTQPQTGRNMPLCEPCKTPMELRTVIGRLGSNPACRVYTCPKCEKIAFIDE
jgi:hypothetical protein